MLIFETERLRVQPYTLADEEVFFALNGDPEVVKYIRPAKDRDACRAFLLDNIAGYQTAPLYGRWAARKRDTGEFVGSFALIPVEGTDEMQLGYALLKAFWGMGYATELTLGGLAYTFTATPLTQIFAYTDPANKPSQAVLLKAGFKQLPDKNEHGKLLTRFVFTRAEWEQL